MKDAKPSRGGHCFVIIRVQFALAGISLCSRAFRLAIFVSWARHRPIRQAREARKQEMACNVVQSYVQGTALTPDVRGGSGVVVCRGG